MKTLLGRALVLSLLIVHFSLVMAQGPLTPASGPTPTMKSLDQIEARTPLAGGSNPITISQPGSYYLTGNVTVTSGDAITITTSDVMLDLKGFTISSTVASAAGNGILFAGANLHNITILNGFIQGGVTNNGGGYSGSGFANGINSSFVPYNVRITGVSVSGCLSRGINLGGSDTDLVESCTARTIGDTGILANVVSNCLAYDCGNYGIEGGTVLNCYGSANTLDGVSATVATNCTGFSLNRNGVSAFAANSCDGYSSAGSGIAASSTSNCYGSSSTGAGISATAANNCFGSSQFGTGISVGSATNCFGQTTFSGTGIIVSDGGILIGCTTTGSSVGISAGKGCTIQNCAARSNTSHGITVSDASMVIACTAQSNGGDGIRVTQFCQVIGNTCNDNGAANDATKAGIHITGADNRIENNHAVSNKFRGILVDAGAHRNFIIKNSAKGNVGLDFDLTGAGDTQYGQIIATPGGNFSSSNPWANFAF